MNSCDCFSLSVHIADPCMVLAIISVDVYNLSKLSADLEPTPCSGQRDKLNSSFYVIVYLYDVKCALCK